MRGKRKSERQRERVRERAEKGTGKEAEAGAGNRRKPQIPVLLFLGVLFPWCFSCCSLVFLSVFCLFPKVFEGWQGEKNPWLFEVFLGIFEKTKEKKDRGGNFKRVP